MSALFKKLFDAADRFGPEQDIPTDRANLGRNVIDNDHPPAAPDGMHNPSFLILSGTALDAAVHVNRLLSSGVTHLGGLGS